jgi:predicted transcriptional regulator
MLPMSISGIDKKEQVLSIVQCLPVPNIEQVARSAGFSRVTVKKYLDELVSAGTIKEARCGNSRIFLLNSTLEARGA